MHVLACRQQLRLVGIYLGEDMPFEDRYVGFIDILGFRELVTQAANAPSAFDSLQRTLKTIAEFRPDLSGEDEDFRATSFSDCIGVSARTTDAGLWGVILFCNSLQFNLWANGILFRGAVTKGALYHDADVIFGPAFIEAYELETRTAIHPRIMLTPAVYTDALKSQERLFSRYVDEYLLTLPYDVPCINPFGGYEKAIMLDAVHALRKFVDARGTIERKLQEAAGNPSILVKWQWLARVYNELIQRLGPATLPGIASIHS
jgi:hypothetical protein